MRFLAVFGTLAALAISALSIALPDDQGTVAASSVEGAGGVPNYHGDRRSDVAVQDTTVAAPEAQVAPVLEAKVMNDGATINCGYAYENDGLRGTQTALTFPTGDGGKFIRTSSSSAIISWGCTCRFYVFNTCQHTMFTNDVFKTGMMQGDLPFVSECVECFPS